MGNLHRSLTVESKPTPFQVSMVLRALADHTAIMEMVQFDRMGKAEQGEDPAQETKYWPTETSISRWFHAVADQLEGHPVERETEETRPTGISEVRRMIRQIIETSYGLPLGLTDDEAVKMVEDLGEVDALERLLADWVRSKKPKQERGCSHSHAMGNCISCTQIGANRYEQALLADLEATNDQASK